MEQIELVIKVRKEWYEGLLDYIQTARISGALSVGALEKNIANGTPLPKGHGALKDADALKKKATMCPTVGNAETLLLDISDVENEPTIIEADKEGAEE